MMRTVLGSGWEMAHGGFTPSHDWKHGARIQLQAHPRALNSVCAFIQLGNKMESGSSRYFRTLHSVEISHGS